MHTQGSGQPVVAHAQAAFCSVLTSRCHKFQAACHTVAHALDDFPDLVAAHASSMLS